jgi:actin-like ATPase involved in cell morphogenesis
MNVSKEKRLVLGCDIGNGFGFASLLTDPNADPMPLFPGAYNLTNIGMPTTAYITPPDGKDIVVFQDGKPAELIYKSKPSQMVSAIKTRFKEGTITVPGVKEPVEVCDIYSAVTRDLLSLAEEELKNKAIKPVYDIVFTFPAAFSDHASLLEMMQRSIEKITLNGNQVRVVGRLPEPAAVAIDYLHYMQHIAPEDVRISENKFTVLVYDLGHGTFDTAVVTAQSEGVPYKLHSKAGLPELGGKNFDEILYQEIVSVLNDQYGYTPQNERQRDIIRQEAVKAKIALSNSESFTVSIFNEDDFCDVEITRERFEELTQHLLFQTLELVQSVLDESIANNIKIDGIVLSGGASKMPMVKNNLEQLVEGEYPIVLYRPSEAVSFGAARFAYGIPDSVPEQEPVPKPSLDSGANQDAKKPDTNPAIHNQVMEQLTDCCYGIWMPAEGKLEGEIQFIVPCGKSRPATSEKVTIYSESSRIVIKIYRSKEKNKLLKTASVEECDSMLWIPFDVKASSTYEVSITVLEDYGLEVELFSEDGNVYKKTTSDLLSKLV